MATPIDTYKTARKAGKGTADSCKAVLAGCPGISFDDVVELSWMVETGNAAPKWQHEDGSPTTASLAWDRGLESKAVGE